MLKTQDYCITRENILVHELIGLPASVLKSTDRAREGVSGRVIDETRNTIIVETRAGEKIVPKNEAVFAFALGNEKVEVDGSGIIYSPAQRIKALWRKRK